jgi:hypothetical protein
LPDGTALCNGHDEPEKGAGWADSNVMAEAAFGLLFALYLCTKLSHGILYCPAPPTYFLQLDSPMVVSVNRPGLPVISRSEDLDHYHIEYHNGGTPEAEIGLFRRMNERGIRIMIFSASAVPRMAFGI